MAKGDHLTIHFGTYSHHGIDLGDDRVIHYGTGLHDKRNAKIEITSREQFSQGQEIAVINSESCFSADEIVERAESRLGENNYDVFENNCEHFVNWCRTGVANSSQVNLVDSVCRRGSAVVARLTLPRFANRFGLKKVAGKLAGRFSLPASLAGDAAQLSAEVVSIRRGKNQQEIRDIGRRSGALASGGVGYMLGGPAGAAVGFSSWLFGEIVGNGLSTTTGGAGKQDCTELHSGAHAIENPDRHSRTSGFHPS